MTYENSTQPNTWEQSTFLPGGSPASPSAPLVDAEELPMHVTSGLKCAASYANAGPLGLLARMLLVYFPWQTSRRSLTWRVKPLMRSQTVTSSLVKESASQKKSWKTLAKKDTKSNRFLFQLAVLVPHTRDTESSSSLIGTPTASMKKRSKNFLKDGQRVPNPAEFVEMFPTPTTMDTVANRDLDNQIATRAHLGLAEYVRLWPTPRANSGVSRKPGTGGRCLQEEARLFPTPSATPRGAHTGKNSGSVDQESNQRTSEKGVTYGATLQTVVGSGQLNPEWVEFLMGYPTGWTDLRDSETL